MAMFIFCFVFVFVFFLTKIYLVLSFSLKKKADHDALIICIGQIHLISEKPNKKVELLKLGHKEM